MNAKEQCRAVAVVIVVLLPLHTVRADSVRAAVRQGNRLYAQGNFNEAVNKYDEALLEQPQATEPRFNKANSYYRLDDLAKAMELYKEVAADSKDMTLVTKARYNLGNSHFQRGLKQRDSNLQEALDDLKTSISCWRGVLDIDPDNEKAAKNIEVARLIIKDILDQLNKQKQQQDPNQPQDPNQQQQQQRPQGQDQQQRDAQQQDPNQPQDANQPQEQKQEDQQQTEEQQVAAADATAREILDREQRQKQERQILQRGRYEKVKKDW